MSQPTPEQVKLAAREMRQRAMVHRYSARTWASIRSHYNEGLDNNLATALEVVASHIEATI